jgi:hypothetical protein
MAEQPYRNLQTAVDNLLGIKSTVRRKRRTKIERNKEIFYHVVTLMEETIVRSNLAFQELNLDLMKYEDKFITVIELLLMMNFGEDAVDIILFYLYDRLNEDGSINPIKTTVGQEVLLSTPYDLWDFLAAANPEINERKA